MSGGQAADDLDGSGEEDGATSSSEESDCRSIHQDLHVELPVVEVQDDVGDMPLERAEALPEHMKADCVRHALSGILHVRAIDYQLLCGRPIIMWIAT